MSTGASMWKFQVTLSTQLNEDELNDAKILCLMQGKSLREWATELVRKELKLRRETIEMGKRSMPAKGQTLREYLNTRVPPRYKRKQREAPKLLSLTDIAKGE